MFSVGQGNEKHTERLEVNTKVTTAKAEIVGLRLTIELPTKYAAELAGLLAGHVNFLDFPWARPIYKALERAGIQDEYVFADSEHGPDIFLQRKPSRNG